MKYFLNVLLVLCCGFSSVSFAYDVGFKRVEVAPAGGAERFDMMVFYPTQADAKHVEFGLFHLNLAIGAPIAEGRFPLAVFSHGSGGSPMSYNHIAVGLASRGFIVAMPLHPGNNFRDNIRAGSVQNYTERPQHLSSAIDFLLALALAPVHNHIQSDKIAVLGHSVGGYTALAVAGGIASTNILLEQCLKNSLTDSYCLAARAGGLEEVSIQHTKDSRVKALALMAPIGVLFAADQALAAVDIPVFMLSAEFDQALTTRYNAAVIANGLPDATMLTHEVITNSGHFSFLTTFPDALKAELGPVAKDPDGFDRAEFEQALVAKLAQWLDSVL